MDNMYSKYHTVIGYRLCNRSFFPHHLRVSVSYSEAGMNVPPFSRFRILLRLRRPQEPSSRPPGRPSPGEVEAGGHGSGRNKRNGPPRVDKGPRSAESTRNPSAATRRFWVSYIYLYTCTRSPSGCGWREIPGITQVEKEHADSTVTAFVGGNMEHGLLYCSKKIVPDTVVVSRNSYWVVLFTLTLRQ